ncbi:MAG: M23 family metallopeptidase [Oscillospiraceae bacterium]|nr:M23 family metallopeptidase [Oscillospiraceae bacterium]
MGRLFSCLDVIISCPKEYSWDKGGMDMRVRLNETSSAVKHRGGDVKRDRGRQLTQLVVCTVLFLVLYIGKGAFPERVAQVGPQLLGVIERNIDFRAAFAALGGTMTDEKDLLEGLEQFCVTVFGAQQETESEDVPVQVLQPEPVRVDEPPQTAVEPESPAYQVGDVVETFAVEGQELPENYTYNELYLGELETADPVEGKLTSAFGYRDHPTIGTYAVHGGVDIGAAKGTAVRAFADATVEFVGESEDFGLYLQLKHENTVSTFYSHCESISVKEGEQVKAGQQIAQVGSTGKSTGPHLHFEVRLGQVRLDPMHYITLREA